MKEEEFCVGRKSAVSERIIFADEEDANKSPLVGMTS